MTEMEEQEFMSYAGGAFAIDHTFKLALRRNVVAQEYCVPNVYGDLSINRASGEHTRGVGWRCHERMQNRCKETTNTETIRSMFDAFAFEGHYLEG
jgi:hypothetical protein